MIDRHSRRRPITGRAELAAFPNLLLGFGATHQLCDHDLGKNGRKQAVA
jgi:hypothetical protein